MGPAGLASQLEEISRAAPAAGDRNLRIVHKPDPDWSYVTGFLMPDAERMQWIQDRRVVNQLVKHGDPLTEPRRVDHWIYFPSEAQRDACCDALTNEHGFVLQSMDSGEPQDLTNSTHPFVAQLHRMDSVALHDIHELVMVLHDVVDRFEGSYDGWETQALPSR